MRTYRFMFWIGYAAVETLCAPLPSSDSAVDFAKQSLVEMVETRHAKSGRVGVSIADSSDRIQRIGDWDWSDDQIIWTAESA